MPRHCNLFLLMSHTDDGFWQKLESAGEREWHVVSIISCSGDCQAQAGTRKQPHCTKCTYLKLQLLHNRLNATCDLHDAICHDVLSSRLIIKICHQQVGSRQVCARTDAVDRRVVQTSGFDGQQNLINHRLTAVCAECCNGDSGFHAAYETGSDFPVWRVLQEGSSLSVSVQSCRILQQHVSCFGAV